MISIIAASASASQIVRDSWSWYIIRASGFTSLSLLILLMISGIGHITGWTYKVLAPVKVWAVHKAMAIMLAISIALHVTGLLTDHYMNFSLSEVLIPFARQYSNGRRLFGINMFTFAVPLGILAAYGSYIVIASSLDTVGWISRHKKLWKTVHIASYFVILFAIFHAVSTGTDFRNGILRWLALALGIILLGMTIVRLGRTRLLKK